MQPLQQLLGKLLDYSSVNTQHVASDIEEKDMVVNALGIADYVEQNDLAIIISDFENLAKQLGENSNQKEVINGWIIKLSNNPSISSESRKELVKGAMLAKERIRRNLLEKKITELETKVDNTTTDVTKRNVITRATSLKVVTFVAFFLYFVSWACLLRKPYNQDLR